MGSRTTSALRGGLGFLRFKSMTSSPIERQHLVSACVLRRWEVEGTILAIDVKTGREYPVTARGAGFKKWFVGPDASCEMEKLWKRIEDRTSQAFAEIDAGNRLSDETVDVLKDIVAVHTVRSFMVFQQWEAQYRRRLGPGSKLLRKWLSPCMLSGLYRDITGLIPTGPEARLIALEKFLGKVSEMRAGGPYFAETLPDLLAKGIEHLRGRSASVSRYQNPDWIVADSPVMPVDTRTSKVGFQPGVSLVSADRILMPIGPYHAIDVGPNGSIYDVTDRAVLVQNMVQVLIAHRAVYLSPRNTQIDMVRRMVALRIENEPCSAP